MTLTRVPIEPAVARWARETAGLDIATAAERIGVKPERVDEWESGTSIPTINQIRSMANTYVRPLAALFLQEPLADDVPRDIPDFRRKDSRGSIPSKALQQAMMRAHRQRDALAEVAADLEFGTEATDPLISANLNDPIDLVAKSLRSALDFDSLPKSTLLQPDLLLRELVRRVESLNITVIQVQRVTIKEMRGFSLGDGPCAIIALNGADWPRGKVYTILHELAHVAFRSNGLCDLNGLQDFELERRCDAVAAAALMPAKPFLKAIGSIAGRDVTADFVRAIGNEFGASGESALLRLVELNRATWDDYWRLKPDFDQAYAAFKADEKAKSANKDAPIYYQVKARDLGRRFIRQMVFAYNEEALSSRDLAQLLEVSFDKVPKLVGLAGEELG